MNAIVSVITGCNDSPQTLALSGDIVGYSTLYDLNENPIANDTGITVSVEGENHTTTTDSMGQWFCSRSSRICTPGAPPRIA